MQPGTSGVAQPLAYNNRNHAQTKSFPNFGPLGLLPNLSIVPPPPWLAR